MKRILLAVMAFVSLVACSDRESAPGQVVEAPATELIYPVSDKVRSCRRWPRHGCGRPFPLAGRTMFVRARPSKAGSNAQALVTSGDLDTIEERGAINARMKELWDYERYSLPVKEGGRYFYSYNDGLQNQDVIYTLTDLNAEPELLIDPNTWSDDGTIALASYFPSPDGKYFAYLVQDGGSDWRVAKVMDVESGEELTDRLDWPKFTELSWAGDSSGFYYSRYPATSEEEKFQSLNRILPSFSMRWVQTRNRTGLFTPTRSNRTGSRASVTDDGNHLVITISVGTDDRYSIVYQDLCGPGSEPVTIIEGFDFDYSLVGSIGDDLYFRTNDGAPRNRLIAINTNGLAAKTGGKSSPKAKTCSTTSTWWEEIS